MKVVGTYGLAGVLLVFAHLSDPFKSLDLQVGWEQSWDGGEAAMRSHCGLANWSYGECVSGVALEALKLRGRDKGTSHSP